MTSHEANVCIVHVCAQGGGGGVDYGDPKLDRIRKMGGINPFVRSPFGTGARFSRDAMSIKIALLHQPLLRVFSFSIDTLLFRAPALALTIRKLNRREVLTQLAATSLQRNSLINDGFTRGHP